ncbi:ATP-binding protein [Desulfonatronospira sp. MSAO_Bac3]|uniref:ATP-binding protein n=1 Tax=Desulfonatronospira sp. MSAO_Bac3 TaxID=2293857 RepID=UPI00257E1113|nr:ATP-binding protein [Desulfonatronospira sp. MSAO_Bac3]
MVNNISVNSERYSENLCILDRATGDYNVGIIGTSHGFASILELTEIPDLEHYFPRMNLLAVAQPDPDDRLLQKVRDKGMRIYSSYQDMLKAHPEINLVIELTGKQHIVREIRNILPAHVSLLDYGAAVFLCGLLIMSQVKDRCRLNLTWHRYLFDVAVDHLQGDMFLLDTKGVILDVNMHVSKRLGKEKDELTGRHCMEIFACPREAFYQGFSNGKSYADAVCPFHKTLATQQPAEAVQTWVDEQGRARYFRIYTYPVFDQSGNMKWVVEMRRDITIRTEMEKRVALSEKLATIGDLSTYIAHEIRNPLFVISGFANVLLRKPEHDETVRENLLGIQRECKRLERILKRFINYARPAKPVYNEIDVNMLVQGVADFFGSMYAEQNVKVEMDLPADLAKAEGAPELLKQCLINLVKNSIESMPQGGTLNLSTFMDEQYVGVRVSDTGKGIPREVWNRAFNPFCATGEGTSAELGLAMTKKILDDMQGRMELSSQEGKGSTITIRIPLLSAMPDSETG